MRYFTILLLSFPFQFLFSQNPEIFNEIYVRTYLETAQTNFDSALEIADSLYQISETPLFQTKSLMLSASLYQQKYDFKNSVAYALKAEKIIEPTNEYIWKSRVHGFLATQYRLLKLNDESKKYLNKGFKDLENVDNPNVVSGTKGLFYQELVYHALDEKNYEQAISYLQQTEEYFNKLKTDGNYLNADIMQLFGTTYSGLGEYETAKNYYAKALETYGDTPDSYLKTLIYSGLARIGIEEKNLEEAEIYLKKADSLAENSNYLEVKKEVYQTYRDFYLAKNDIINLTEVNKNLEKINTDILDLKSSFINESFTTLSANKDKLMKSSKRKNTILLAAGILFVSGIIYFLWYRRNQRREILRFKEILKEIEEKRKKQLPAPEVIRVREATVSHAENSQDSDLMAKQTVEKILMKLKKFEDSEKFKNNKVSLSTLATYCETNTKYLSHVINNYKQKDFNNYINELRINYIIDKLQQDPKYRKYKISVIADDAGFSSQNKFSTVFKNITTISPSSFIQFLEKEKI